MYAVFRDDNSHCCIRVSEVNGLVEYIALFEEGGAIRVDLFKANGREFYDTYNHELTEYPTKRAAKHFMNPLTSMAEVW